MIAPALIPFVVTALICDQALEAEGCHMSCNFDKNLCDYEQSTDDDADWKRIRGRTGSSGTGPSSDHTTGDGWYVYFEASTPRKEGDFADLRGPVMETNSSSVECFRFYYHMQGSGMGSLKVLTYSKKRRIIRYTEVWKKEGEQSKNGTDWKRAEVSIREAGPYQLVFRATRGPGYQSDIGLDDIGMSHKPCEVFCPEATNVRNGYVVMSSLPPYNVGTEAVWYCDFGYVHIGDRSATCMENGKWSNVDPVCTEIVCPNLPQVPSGRRQTNPSPPYESGTIVVFSCDEGYELIGPSKIACLPTGEWSSAPPSCKAPACVRDLNKVEPGRRCVGRCQANGPGWQCGRGPNVCRCDDSCGMSCVNPGLACPGLSNPEHGSVTVKSRKYGQTARYKCDAGFSLTGPSERSCRSDRKWSGIAPSCVLLSVCGQSGAAGSVKKIIRGSNAERGAWPWQAILSRNRDRTLLKNIVGAGSLINEEWVLSAAHVMTVQFPYADLVGNWNDSFIIALGLTNLWRSELPEYVQVFAPQSVHVHPQFDTRSFDFDVALIRIGKKMRRLESGRFVVDENSHSGKVIYSHFVRPVCLPCVTGVISNPVDVWMNFDADLCTDKGKYILSSIAPPGSEAIVTGFGSTGYFNRTFPEVLQEGRIKIFNNSQCAKEVEGIRAVVSTGNYTDQMLCGSGGTESAMVDTCLGDAGGPLVSKQVEIRRDKKIEYWLLIGIVSWGLRCAERHGFYTSVPSVMKWIWQTLDHVRNEGTPCASRPCHSRAFCTTKNKDVYICTCKSGYTGDGKFCRKILPCDSLPCHQYATCFNAGESRFVCKCNAGHKGDGKTCKKTIPCESSPCRLNENCFNTPDDRYICKCKRGYTSDGKVCKKNMPCDLKPCHENAMCWNGEKTGYLCQCKTGYKGDGKLCTKILPCSSTPCDLNAECKNERNNRFSCKCRSGYKGNGETCKKILPCDAKPCDLNAECKNERNNRFSCKCRSGYKGDGETCKKSTTTCGDCDAAATCVKLGNDRYRCECKTGFKGDGNFCKKIHCPNIDGVGHGNYRTSSQAPYAIGTVANFTCDVGFKAQGKFSLRCLIGGRWSAPIPYCVANVCKRDLRRIEKGRKCRKPCKRDSQCKGAFKRCQCDDWCGRSCFNQNADCARLTQPHNGYIIENGQSYGRTVTYGCNEGFTLNGPSTRICRSDRTWSGYPPICLPFSACGQSVEVRGSSSFGKVRGGSNAKQGAWPWQALLIDHLKRTVEEILDMQKVFGGGSVINDEWILSAAHVFNDLFFLSTENNKWDNTFLIILGMTNYPKPGHGIPDHFQIFQPQNVHLHPKFNPLSLDYDIALIHIGKRVTSDGKTSFKAGGIYESRRITFTRYVRPVCLPCMKENPAKSVDVLKDFSKKICAREGSFTISPHMKNTIMVTGFGRTSHNGSFFPTTLQQGALKIRDDLQCSESLNDILYYNEHARFTERMFCASSANESQKVDACQGDSGGPVVVKMKSNQRVEYWRQIGIVSWGFKCADKHPGFYTSIYSFMEWIWKILDNEKKAVVCSEKFFRDDSHYNVTFCPAGMSVGAKCSLKCENGYKWTLKKSVWSAKCTLKGSSDSIAEWDFHNAPTCEV